MTYEDVKRIRENPTSKDVDNRELSRMIDRAIEKEIVNPVIKVGTGIRWSHDEVMYDGCPICKCEVFTGDNYCRSCGQRVR